MSGWAVKCKQCGIIERGSREECNRTLESHDQFHSTSLLRPATDGGQDVERLYYATASNAARRHLHVDEHCDDLKQAKRTNSAPVTHPPRGNLCDCCAPDMTLADLQEGAVATDGGEYECDACGETFRTLSKLRLHEKDDCRQRETFGRIDPDAADADVQGATGLLTCRECGDMRPDADYDETASFDGEDYHLIVEFECRACGFDNENRLVMEGVDRESLEDLPPHLQPDDQIATDGGRPAGQSSGAAATPTEFKPYGAGTVRQLAGVGDQDPTCEHGVEGCPGPGGGLDQCFDCFLEGGGQV